MGGNSSKYMSSGISDSESEHEYVDEYESCQEDVESVVIENINVYEEIDAAMRNTASLPKAQDVLDVHKVNEIEDKLGIEDIVSLAYLLLEDSNEIEYTLQSLLLLLSGGNRKILSQWAQYNSSKGKNWQNKLIEALCIIKHFEILKSMGYEKSNVSNHFLPNNRSTLHVDKLKKAIYHICENLDEKETKAFLSHVREKYKRQNITFDEFGTNYLELYFLKWESMKTLDLHEIKAILKSLNFVCVYNILDSALPESSSQLSQENTTESFDERERPLTSFQVPHNSQTLREAFSANNIESRIRKISTCVDNNIPRGNSLCEKEYLVSQPDWQQPSLPTNVNKHLPNKNLDHKYPIDKKNPGVIFIINQESFYRDVNKKYENLLAPYPLPIREGTQRDKAKLEKIFNAFGFKVIVENNLTHYDIISLITEVVKDVTVESSLFICILSHGANGVVYGSNSCEVKVTQIQEIMCSFNKEHLIGKPKVLILQSCQGEKCETLDNFDDEEAEDNMSLTTDGGTPVYRDFLTFWATIPGYAAVRNKKKGTWFIQEFCKALMSYANTNHLIDICTMTSAKVAQNVWISSEKEKRIMTPKLESTLQNFFYLPALENINNAF